MEPYRIEPWEAATQGRVGSSWLYMLMLEERGKTHINDLGAALD